MTSLIDSMPIITCGGKNKTRKVVTELVAKGYCSTKNMYYFGLKLHALAFRRQGTLPFPEMLILSSAAENDLTVLKTEAADRLTSRNIFADKIYSDFPFWEEKQKSQGVCMLTPVKAIKGEEPVIKQREKAGRDLFGAAMSKIRAQDLYKDMNAPAHERILDLLSKLTIEEKISLLRATSPGIPRMGIDK